MGGGNSKETKTADENKPVNDSQKGREYMKDRRADDNFKKHEIEI